MAGESFLVAKVSGPTNKTMTVSLYGRTAVVRTIIRETDPKVAILRRLIATDIFVKRSAIVDGHQDARQP